MHQSSIWFPVRAQRSNILKWVVTFPSSLTLIDLPQVRWTRVPDLVEKRRVLLKDGWAYVPSKEQSSIVFQEFQTRLERALEVVCRPYAKGLMLNRNR